MRRYDYDLFTIGAGSGGVRASRLAGAAGARVAVAEDRQLGGTCVNLGCIPKKLLVYAAHLREDLEDAAGYGWSVPPASFDWPALIANKDRELARLALIYGRLLGDAGVDILDGRARVVDPHTVEVAGRSITAERLLIATGGRPDRPDLPGVEHAITSDEAFHLKALPRRVAVVGAGYIGVEFAGIFHGLGARTTLLGRGRGLLRGFDDDLRVFLAEQLAEKGLDLRFHAPVRAIERLGDDLRVDYGDGQHLLVDAVLLATGRRPNTAGLGLTEAGVALTERGAVVVDDHLCSSVPSIFAIGDVTDQLALTPVAIVHGAAFAQREFGAPAATLPDLTLAPTAVFSQPPLASVGLSEHEARRQYGAVHVYQSAFRPLKNTLSGRRERTFMKLIVDPVSDRVLGVHMVGVDAPEIIQSLAVALRCGATKAQFDGTLALHPTAAEEFVTMRHRRAPTDADH
jgi:glutathione reductase (NADPH)